MENGHVRGGRFVRFSRLVLLWIVAVLATGTPTGEAWMIRRRIEPILRFDKDGEFKIVQVGSGFVFCQCGCQFR